VYIIEIESHKKRGEIMRARFDKIHGVYVVTEGQEDYRPYEWSGPQQIWEAVDCGDYHNLLSSLIEWVEEVEVHGIPVYAIYIFDHYDSEDEEDREKWNWQAARKRLVVQDGELIGDEFKRIANGEDVRREISCEKRV